MRSLFLRKSAFIRMRRAGGTRFAASQPQTVVFCLTLLALPGVAQGQGKLETALRLLQQNEDALDDSRLEWALEWRAEETDAKGAVRETLERWKGAWTFSRGQGVVSGEGDYRSGQLSMKWHYWFSGLTGLAGSSRVTFGGKAPNNLELRPVGVWRNSIESVRLTPSYQEAFDPAPEDIALLSGLSVLKVYGARWNVVREDAKILELRMAREGTLHPQPSELVVTLDARRAYLPIRIRRIDEVRDIAYSIDGWHRESNGWLPSRIVRTAEFRNTPRRNVAEWRLLRNGEQVSAPLPPFAKSQLVSDSRLAGADISPRELLRQSVGGQSKVVHYKWPGHIPSLAELEVLRDEEMARRGFLGGRSVSRIGIAVSGFLLVLIAGAMLFSRRNRYRPSAERASRAP